MDVTPRGGTTICSKCQTEMQPGRIFCPGCGVQLRPSNVLPQGPLTPGVPKGSPESPDDPPEKVTPVGAIVGGTLLAGGSVLPWATITTPFGTLARSGVDDGGDGLITLGLGVVALLAGVSALTARRAVAQGLVLLAAGAVSGYVAATDLAVVSDIASTTGIARAAVGSGLYAACLGAGLCALSGLALLSRR